MTSGIFIVSYDLDKHEWLVQDLNNTHEARTDLRVFSRSNPDLVVRLRKDRVYVIGQSADMTVPPVVLQSRVETEPINIVPWDDKYEAVQEAWRVAGRAEYTPTADLPYFHESTLSIVDFRRSGHKQQPCVGTAQDRQQYLEYLASLKEAKSMHNVCAVICAAKSPAAPVAEQPKISDLVVQVNQDWLPDGTDITVGIVDCTVVQYRVVYISDRVQSVQRAIALILEHQHDIVGDVPAADARQALAYVIERTVQLLAATGGV